MTELAAQRQPDPATPPAGAEGPAVVRKPKANLNGARSFWLKQLHSWHWISAAVSLVGMILFAITGITLNHAASIPGTPVTVEQTKTLPAPLLQRLKTFPEETTQPVPDAVARWASEAFKVEIAGKPT
ncbi:MAG: PepSY-associated TM helix domain-containing protein, partial [Rhizobiales bacterium]|nr:PepSY-associated TM helix domain-containing protein [Hyphomicrobiales bacterium]